MGEKSTASSPGPPCSPVAVGALLSGEETQAQGLLRKPWVKWNLMPIYSKSQEGHTHLRTRSLPLETPVMGPNLPEASLPAPTVQLVIWSNPRNSRTASHHLLLSLCRCRSFCPEQPSLLPHTMGSTWPSHNTSSEKHSVLTPLSSLWGWWGSPSHLLPREGDLPRAAPGIPQVLSTGLLSEDGWLCRTVRIRVPDEQGCTGERPSAHAGRKPVATQSPDLRRKNPCLLDFQSRLHAPSDAELSLSLGKLPPHRTFQP